MQLGGRLEIKSPEKIEEFLRSEHTGRISSVDADGFPQVIPMNFAQIDGCIYMHSHIRGEKLDNIARNPKVGFEVDHELEFLPSYFEDPKDASFADTLYVSVVIKGTAYLVSDGDEAARALNALMEKYQPEGRYERVSAGDGALSHVAVIKIVPVQVRGKYKIGQTVGAGKRMELAKKILGYSPRAAKTLKVMGFEVRDGVPVMTDEPVW